MLFEILYVSEIAPRIDLCAISDIARKSRVFNQAHQITGVLIFDGMRFCEQLEGSEQAVTQLMSTIRRDPRHTAICVLHRGELAERRFHRFSMGYTVVEEDALDALSTLTGQDAITTFTAMIPRLDLDS